MRIKAALLATGLAVGAVVGLAGTADACTSAGGGHTCLYSASNFNGSRYDDGALSRPDWGALTYIGTNVRLYAGDGSLSNVSSMSNWDQNSRVAVYYNSNYRGPCFTIEAFGSVGNMYDAILTDGSRANDRMNSHHYNRTCGRVYSH
jgi:hypothetical protein